VAVAGRAEPAVRPPGDPRRRARRGMGRGRRAGRGRGLADGRLGAEPGRPRRRHGERVVAAGLPVRAARPGRARRRRLALLRARLPGRRPAGRAGGIGDGPCRTEPARAEADPRLRAQPRGPGPPGDRRPSELVHPGQRRRPGRRPRRLVRGGRPHPGVRPRPLLPAVAGRRPAERVRQRPAGGHRRHADVDRRAVRRRPLRHGDAGHQRHLRRNLGCVRRSSSGSRRPVPASC
jgi:hypothetical protein